MRRLEQTPPSPLATSRPEGTQTRRFEPDRLAAQVPTEVASLLMRARAELHAAAIERLPLPLYEVWKLKSFDPFVARATASSDRTSGRHFVLLAGTPMTHQGGGQRTAQLARELLARAHRVTYVYRSPGPERGRRVRTSAHENLTHVPFADFSARSFTLERGARERVVAICSLPTPEYRACLSYLQSRGASTVYDCTDEWAAGAGRGWFASRTELGLLRETDLVVASSRSLKDHLEARSWREVALLSNAVDSRLFARGRTYAHPSDLPRAQSLYLYAGALGPFFDWDWLEALARARPDAAVVLIGDERPPCRPLPRNLTFLGPRLHADLPAYFAHAHVCLLPYRVDRLERSGNPLKLFEYLAMGRPVVASEMPEISGVPGVLTARTATEFVDAVERARTFKPPEDLLARFVAENSWKVRVRQLERLLGL